MKKVFAIIFLSIFVALFISSCNARRPGVVPCPSYSYVDSQNIDVNN